MRTIPITILIMSALALAASASFNPNTELLGINISVQQMASLTDQELQSALVTTWTFNQTDIIINEQEVSFPYRHWSIIPTQAVSGEPVYLLASKPEIASLDTRVVDYCLVTYPASTCTQYLVNNLDAFNYTINDEVVLVQPLLYQWTAQMTQEYRRVRHYRDEAAAWVAANATRTRIGNWLRTISGVNIP